MKKHNIKYIYFDLDGTFLNENKKISNNALETLEKLREKNIKYGIITGRPYYLCYDIVDAVKPSLPTISINGNSFWYHKKDQKDYSKLFSKDTINKITNYCEDNKITYMAYGINSIFIKQYSKNKHVDWLMKNIKEQDEKFKTPITEYNNQEQLLKFLILTHKMSKEQILKFENFVREIVDAYAVFSQTKLFDIMPLDVDKGLGIKKIAKQNIISLENLLVIGDSFNDIPMFKVAKISVAMKNSKREIIENANLKTKFTNAENGMSKFLNNYFDL